MEGAKTRGFIRIPFILTEAEAAGIAARWGLSTRLAHRQTAQIVLDNDARNNDSKPIPYEGPIYFPSLDARKESDGSD